MKKKTEMTNSIEALLKDNPTKRFNIITPNGKIKLTIESWQTFEKKVLSTKK